MLVSDYLVPVSMGLVLLSLWFMGEGPLARQRHQIGVYVALASMGLSSLAVFIINTQYFRLRPFDGIDGHDVILLFYQPTDSSFPANPAAVTFGLAAGVWGVNRPVGAVLLVASGMFGFARVYAGVHYPLDVLAGALIGIVVTFLMYKAKALLGPIPVWTIKAARILSLA